MKISGLLSQSFFSRVKQAFFVDSFMRPAAYRTAKGSKTVSKGKTHMRMFARQIAVVSAIFFSIAAAAQAAIVWDLNPNDQNAPV